MKKVLTLLLMLILNQRSLTLTAQDVQFGSEQITSAYNNQPMLLGVSDGFLYVIRVTGYKNNIYSGIMKSDGKAVMGALLVGMGRFTNDAPFNEERLFYTQYSRYYFEKYDADMNLVTSKELDVEITPKGDLFDFIKFAMVGDEIVAFTYDFNEGTNENSINVHPITKDGVFSKQGRKLKSYSTTNRYNSGRKDHSFRVLVSPDRTKCLVMHSELEFPKNEAGKKTMSLELFDRSFASAWKEELEIPITARTVSMEKVKL